MSNTRFAEMMAARLADPSMPRPRMSMGPRERAVGPLLLNALLARQGQPVDPSTVDPRELDMRARREWLETNPMPEQPLSQEQRDELAFRHQSLERPAQYSAAENAVMSDMVPGETALSIAKTITSNPKMGGMTPLSTIPELDEMLMNGDISRKDYDRLLEEELRKQGR